MKLDARAWVVWVAALLLLVLSTRNPLYLLLLLFAMRVVAAHFPAGSFSLPLGRLAGVILLFSTLFNWLLTHSGQTVLLTLPSSWPLIGGRLTLETAVFGFSNGLLLLTLLALFATFSQVVAAGELVRLTPRALIDLGLVVLIALTYLPETVRQLQRIREAQAIRGHRLRGWRDWRPIALPLLVGGLERAMNLAEAMVARGYGATTSVGQPLAIRLLLTLGLALGLAGWLLTFWWAWLGWLLLLLGVGGLTAVLYHQGQRVQITRFRPHRWGWRESVVVITAVLPPLLLLIPWPFMPPDLLFYTPYPRVTLPTFTPWVGVVLAVYVAPALV